MLRKFIYSSSKLFCTVNQVQKLAGQHSGIALFEINNPTTKNALSKELIDDMKEAINQVNNDQDIRVIIVKSKIPGVFCAGADLKQRLKMTNEEVEDFVVELRGTFDQLYHVPVPTIACIDGPALGGGLELAISCDLRVASKSSIFGLPETSLAIIPGAGGTQKLARVIGTGLAKELIYTGRRLTAQEALQYGLLNYVEEDFEQIYKKTLELTESILKKGPVAIRQAKQAVNISLETDLDTGLKKERELYAKVISTEDRIEGLRAFLEKRKPIYKGK